MRTKKTTKKNTVTAPGLDVFIESKTHIFADAQT